MRREMCGECGSPINDDGSCDCAKQRAVVRRKPAKERAMTDHPLITHAHGCWSWGRRHYECAVEEIEHLRTENEHLRAEVERDKALLSKALDALEYASDMTKPTDLHGCTCPICTSIAAIKERLK